MDLIKNKLFQVLTERITVSEFEYWLYNNDKILGEINENSFYFDVVTINYRTNDWNTKLNNLIQSHFEIDYLEILKIKKLCLEIITSKTFEEIRCVLVEVSEDFDYDTEYSILWKLYSLHDYFELVVDGVWEIGTLQEQAFFYSNQTLEKIEINNDFVQIKKALETSLTPFEKKVSKEKFKAEAMYKFERKTTLKQKIFAFFKKI